MTQAGSDELACAVAKIQAQCDAAPGKSPLIMVSKAHLTAMLAALASPKPLSHPEVEPTDEEVRAACSWLRGFAQSKDTTIAEAEKLSEIADLLETLDTALALAQDTIAGLMREPEAAVCVYVIEEVITQWRKSHASRKRREEPKA